MSPSSSSGWVRGSTTSCPSIRIHSSPSYWSSHESRRIGGCSSHCRPERVLAVLTFPGRGSCRLIRWGDIHGRQHRERRLPVVKLCRGHRDPHRGRRRCAQDRYPGRCLHRRPGGAGLLSVRALSSDHVRIRGRTVIVAAGHGSETRVHTLDESCPFASRSSSRQGPGQLSRFSFRTTKRRPDHVSSTAITLLSTMPVGRNRSRKVCSVSSVSTPSSSSARTPRSPHRAGGP